MWISTYSFPTCIITPVAFRSSICLPREKIKRQLYKVISHIFLFQSYLIWNYSKIILWLLQKQGHQVLIQNKIKHAILILCAFHCVQKNRLTIIRRLLSCDILVSVDLEGRSITPSWRLLKLISFADFQTKTSCRLWTKLTSQKCLKNYNILTSDSPKGGISIDREWDERGINHGSTGWFSKLCRHLSLLETDCQRSWQPFKSLKWR